MEGHVSGRRTVIHPDSQNPLLFIVQAEIENRIGEPASNHSFRPFSYIEFGYPLNVLQLVDRGPSKKDQIAVHNIIISIQLLIR